MPTAFLVYLKKTVWELESFKVETDENCKTIKYIVNVLRIKRRIVWKYQQNNPVKCKYENKLKLSRSM